MVTRPLSSLGSFLQPLERDRLVCAGGGLAACDLLLLPLRRWIVAVRHLLANDGALLPRLSECDFGIRPKAEQLLLARQVVTLAPPAPTIRLHAEEQPVVIKQLVRLLARLSGADFGVGKLRHRGKFCPTGVSLTVTLETYPGQGLSVNE